MIDRLTGDQRSFLAFAQAWRDKAREDADKQQVASDPHSPARYGIIGLLKQSMLVQGVQRNWRQILSEARGSRRTHLVNRRRLLPAPRNALAPERILRQSVGRAGCSV